jgi:acetate kinase
LNAAARPPRKGNIVHVLALNAGSSSLKFGVYAAGTEPLRVLLTGEAPSVESVAQRIAQADLPAVDAVGHRIVHGGPRLRRHCRIDAQVLAELEAAAPFAPLHAPVALAAIRYAQAHFPDKPQVACFDTSFHANMPEVARVLPIAHALRADGVERYGFHGLSCESIVQQLGSGLPDRLIIAHLGNGASVTAVRSGRSVDTTMGLTPTGGLIMGTRSGDLDPGVLVYLMRTKALLPEHIERMVDHESGLLGISGIDSDMRRLHAAAATEGSARLAIDMFCSIAAKHIAAMITVLGGVDLIVFTGGIGENDAVVRASICRGLSWFGIALAPAANDGAADPGGGALAASAAGSRCSIRVMVSQEDEQIARHTAALVDPPTA